MHQVSGVHQVFGVHQVSCVHQVRSQVSAPLLVASYSPLLACTSLPSWFKEQSILLDASARLNRVECQAKKTSRNSTQSKTILQRYLWRLLQRATNVPPMYQCRNIIVSAAEKFSRRVQNVSDISKFSAHIALSRITIARPNAQQFNSLRRPENQLLYIHCHQGLETKHQVEFDAMLQCCTLHMGYSIKKTLSNSLVNSAF